MPSRAVLSLVLALSAGAATAQSFYKEEISYPNVGHGASQAHAAPVTVDVSSAVDPRLAPGSAVVTFVSHPAPSVRLDAQSIGVPAVLSAQLQYEFVYTGPALSYVPIDFRGVFDIQHGSPVFNRTEVEFVLSAYSQDFKLSQSVRVGVDCSRTCRYFSPPLASGLSSIQAPFTSSAAATGVSPSSATGGFSGVLMGGTDANGRGLGMVQLRALASAGGSVARSWAFIDPSLIIDASFLAAHPESSLTLPPGVGNAVTAVPEPQAGALMLAGLLGLGGLARRRQAG